MENLEPVSSGHLFPINRSQYCELIPLSSTDDGCSGYQGDLSSDAPSTEAVTSISQYSMNGSCSGYQGDLLSDASLVESVTAAGFARPFQHAPSLSNNAAFLAMGDLALGVPYGHYECLAPSSLLEGSHVLPFSAPGTSWMPRYRQWLARRYDSFFLFFMALSSSVSPVWVGGALGDLVSEPF